MSTSAAVNATKNSTAVPKSWPGAFGLYKYSKVVIRRNLWTILGLYVASVLVSAVLLALFDKDSEHIGPVDVLVQLISIIFSTAITVTLLRSAAGKKISLATSLSEALPYYIQMLLVSILLVVISVASFVAFIIPFFIIVPRLVLSEYFVVDKNMNALEALKASWRLTKGNVSKVWAIIGANLAMALLLLTIIGIPFAVYLLFMYSGAQVVLYTFLRDHK